MEKEYLIGWYYLEQGMEGIPNLEPAFIVKAKDKKEAIKKYPKDIKKQMKGYGHICLIGEIKNGNILIEKDFYNIHGIVNDVFKRAKRI